MGNLLFVTCHPLTANESKSLKTAEVFLKNWKDNHKEDTVYELDLYKETIPMLNKEIFETWGKMKSGQPFSELSQAEQDELSQHNKLLNQFINADKIVFVNPMWNHFMPSLMKQYIDVLCVTGKTFKYTATGLVGLLQNKKVLHIQSAGGMYDHNSKEIVDYGDAYLKHMMDFFGITDYQAIFIEGADAFPDKANEILQKAQEQAKEAALNF